jgi:hypothetical protein
MVEHTSYMFVTGPERREDGHARRHSSEELGGAQDAREVRASRTSRRPTTRAASRCSAGCSRSCRSTTSSDPPFECHRRSDARGRGARLDRPDRVEQALRRARTSSRASSTTATSSRSTSGSRATSSSASRGSAGRASACIANQPNQLAGVPRHRRVTQGRALRALLRRVQHSVDHVRGRAGLPAGHGAGVRRDHRSRREAALRVLRSDGAEADRDPA